MMVRLRRHTGWLMVVAGLMLPSASWSGESVPVGYREIAAERDVPQSVLYAVALTESGRRVVPAGVYRPWPWTLNVAGRGYFFDSRQQAWQALREQLKDGKRSIDIGLMQVNWRYHQSRLGSPWQALDPYHNLSVGAEILQECYITRQDWWASVGCYHSPSNQRRADEYRRRVISRWQRIVNAGSQAMNRLNRYQWRAVIATCLLVPVVAQAELTVIYDSGNTKPIAPFLEAFESTAEIQQQTTIPTKPPLGAADPKAWLPIQSPGLTPGVVKARAHDRPFARPFFLIGSDIRSRQWLQDHRDQLKEIGAVGMLVQADTLEDLQATANLSGGLSIMPASASDIAKALGVSHYPVLITSKGIEQ